MTCQKPGMAVRRKKSFGNQRKARATRKYVRAPMDVSPAVRVYSRKFQKGVARGRGAAKYHAGGFPSCTKKYAASLVDPSGDHSKGACLPAGFPMPSQKIRAFARGFMSTGTTGDGFLYMAPCIVSDGANILVTSATSAGTAATAFNAFTNTVAASIPKIPYTTLQVVTNKTVEGRLVSACIRVRYSGTEDSRSGVVSLFEDPDHLDVSASSANGISLYDSCGKQRVFGDGGWHQINWSGPCKQAEQEYVSTALYSTTCLVIAINGTTTAAGALGPQPFEYEVWENLEFLGRDVVGKTNNVLDPDGTVKVQGMAKVAQSGPDPLNPQTGESLLRKVFAGKPGGTAAGDIIHGAVSTFNPGAGMVWGGLRKIFGYGRFRKGGH